MTGQGPAGWMNSLPPARQASAGGPAIETAATGLARPVLMLKSQSHWDCVGEQSASTVPAVHHRTGKQDEPDTSAGRPEPGACAGGPEPGACAGGPEPGTCAGGPEPGTCAGGPEPGA